MSANARFSHKMAATFPGFNAPKVATFLNPRQNVGLVNKVIILKIEASGSEALTADDIQVVASSLGAQLCLLIPADLEYQVEVRRFIEQLFGLDSVVAAFMSAVDDGNLSQMSDATAKARLDRLMHGLAAIRTRVYDAWWVTTGDQSKLVLPTSSPGLANELKELLRKL